MSGADLGEVVDMLRALAPRCADVPTGNGEPDADSLLETAATELEALRARIAAAEGLAEACRALTDTEGAMDPDCAYCGAEPAHEGSESCPVFMARAALSAWASTQ